MALTDVILLNIWREILCPGSTFTQEKCSHVIIRPCRPRALLLDSRFYGENAHTGPGSIKREGISTSSLVSINKPWKWALDLLVTLWNGVEPCRPLSNMHKMPSQPELQHRPFNRLSCCKKGMWSNNHFWSFFSSFFPRNSTSYCITISSFFHSYTEIWKDDIQGVRISNVRGDI